MHADNLRVFPHRAGHAARRCVLRAASGEYSGTLRSVSAAGAFVETVPSICIDDQVVLMHPEAGQINARVVRLARDGAALAFTVGEQAATFALAAICADMTDGARSDA